MVPGTGLVPGVVTVGVGAVGGWTSGSDFSLQPPAASVADAAIPTTIDLRAARPAFDPDSTADIIPVAYSGRVAAGSERRTGHYSTTIVPLIRSGCRVQT